MTDGWRCLLLEDAVDILDSRRIPVNSKERSLRTGNVPYYGATGQVGSIDNHIFDEELVLLGEDGAPFLDPMKPKAYLVRGKSWVNNHAHVLRGKKDLLNSFLLYQLNAFDYRPYVSGTTRLKLPQGRMRQIPLPIPPLDEQRRIVAEIEKQFTRLDAGVAALKRVQANLKRYRGSVLKAACEGRLVQTEASRSGVSPLNKQKRQDAASTFEPASVLLERILEQRRKNWAGRGKYKEPNAPDISKLPELPGGWVWASVEQLSSPEKYALAIGPFGSNLKVSDYKSHGVPLIFVRNIRNRKFGDKTAVYVAKKKAEQLVAHHVSGNDVLITKMGDPPGDACLYPPQEPDAIITADCIKLRLAPILHERTFFVHAINSEVVKHQILGITKGVAQQKVSLGRFLSIAIPLPPLAEQSRIVAEVERRLSVIEEIEAVVNANLQRAGRLRQSILQQAFSGKLITS